MFPHLCFLDPEVHRGPGGCVVTGHALLHGWRERHTNTTSGLSFTLYFLQLWVWASTSRLTLQFGPHHVGVSLDVVGQSVQLSLCSFTHTQEQDDVTLHPTHTLSLSFSCANIGFALISCCLLATALSRCRGHAAVSVSRPWCLSPRHGASNTVLCYTLTLPTLFVSQSRSLSH